MIDISLKLKSKHSLLAFPMSVPFIFSVNSCRGWHEGIELELGWRVHSPNVFLGQLRSKSKIGPDSFTH